jgi:hypothetical protein
MFAADCPTKRAAFMIDMTLGCWSHVPAISTSICRSCFTCWKWRPAKPRTGMTMLFCVLHVCRNLVFHFEATQECGEIFLAMAMVISTMYSAPI